MNNYSVMIKNSAKADLKKIKQSNLKPQFEKVIQTLKEDPWNGNSFFDKFYKVQNFFPYAIPIVLDNEPPRM